MILAAELLAERLVTRRLTSKSEAILACPFETLRVRVMAPTEKRSFGEVAGEAVLRL